MKLLLPFAHRILGVLHNGPDTWVLVERVDVLPSGAGTFITYRCYCAPLGDEWVCEHGNYDLKGLMEAQVDLIKRAGWWR